MHHGRAEGHGRLAEAMQHSDCRDAIHRRVLDRGIRLRFTLHLLADRMVRKAHAFLWTSGPGVFIQACILIIIRMSAEQPMTLPSADGFQCYHPFFSYL